MGKFRTIIFSDPNGNLHKITRRKDQSDPKYAILSTRDGISWGVLRVTQRDEDLVFNVKEMLNTGQSVYITKPIT